MKYTSLDHLTVLYLRELGDYEPAPFECRVSNRQVGDRFDISVSGGAARLARLERLGVINVEYEALPELGRTLARKVTVNYVPKAPWE